MDVRGRRPNVLLVIMDDLAYGDLACHGNPSVRTPALDRLHGESVRLTRHCSGPLCTPARASLLTGRHHLRTGAIDTYLGRDALHGEEITFAQLLQAQGYATGMFGKWHVGDHFPSRPQDKGFAETCWHRGGGIGQPGDFRGNTYFDPVVERDGRAAGSRGYCTDVFGGAAERFIRDHADEPWLCYLGTNAPHSPFEVPDDWAQPYRAQGLPEVWARLYAMVENIDANVGRLLETLDELNLSARTIVIYTSDHGPCRSANAEGRVRYNAGLRETKGTLYEGGVRVPMFVRWPARLPAGVDLDRLSSPMDVLPTLGAACGFNVPPDRAIDGENLLPLLSGEVAPGDWSDRTVMMQWHRGDAPQRWRNAAVITQRHKLYRPTGGEGRGALGEFELYDLEADPGETRDVAREAPAVVERLRARYEAWFDGLTAERGEATWAPEPARLGHEAEPEVTLTRQGWRLYPEVDEGWGTGKPGWWPVTVTRAGRYEVQVLLPWSDLPRDQALTLRLRCGAWSVARKLTYQPRVQPGRAWVERFTADLSAGRADFEAFVEGAGARYGVERVIVRSTEQ